MITCRYFTISKIRNEFCTTERLTIVLSAFSVAILGKLPMVFEVEASAPFHYTNGQRQNETK